MFLHFFPLRNHGSWNKEGGETKGRATGLISDAASWSSRIGPAMGSLSCELSSCRPHPHGLLSFKAELGIPSSSFRTFMRSQVCRHSSFQATTWIGGSVLVDREAQRDGAHLTGGGVQLGICQSAYLFSDGEDLGSSPTPVHILFNSFT